MVEWNPEEMRIVDAFDIDRPDVDEDLDAQHIEPYWVGNLVLLPVDAVNWDTLATGPAIVAGFDPSD